MLYSQAQVERASHVTNMGPISVEHVRTILRQHIMVKECDVFVYLSIEGDLVALIMPVTVQATPLQVSKHAHFSYNSNW